MDGYDTEALEAMLQRLRGIDPENVYEGFVGHTVGESIELIEEELEKREEETIA